MHLVAAQALPALLHLLCWHYAIMNLHCSRAQCLQNLSLSRLAVTAWQHLLPVAAEAFFCS